MEPYSQVKSHLRSADILASERDFKAAYDHIVKAREFGVTAMDINANMSWDNLRAIQIWRREQIATEPTI